MDHSLSQYSWYYYRLQFHGHHRVACEIQMCRNRIKLNQVPKQTPFYKSVNPAIEEVKLCQAGHSNVLWSNASPRHMSQRPKPRVLPVRLPELCATCLLMFGLHMSRRTTGLRTTKNIQLLAVFLSIPMFVFLVGI